MSLALKIGYYGQTFLYRVEEEDWFPKVRIFLRVLDDTGLDHESSTFKLDAWRRNIGQLIFFHVPYSPTQHLTNATSGKL